MVGSPFYRGRRPLPADRLERMHTALAEPPYHRPMIVQSAQAVGHHGVDLAATRFMKDRAGCGIRAITRTE